MSINKNKKDKLMTIRISGNLFENYKKFCDINSINMSARIRRFMESELKNWNELQKRRNDNE